MMPINSDINSRLKWLILIEVDSIQKMNSSSIKIKKNKTRLILFLKEERITINIIFIATWVNEAEINRYCIDPLEVQIK